MRNSMMTIQTSLHPLNRADGSATYTSPNGYSILAAVNGPVEVQRRDELPDEAHIEVNVQPHDGVGQVKERHLELLIANTLRDVIFVQLFPRQMVQLTLQIMKVPVDDSAIGRSNPQAETVRPSFTLQSLLGLMSTFSTSRFSPGSSMQPVSPLLTRPFPCAAHLLVRLSHSCPKRLPESIPPSERPQLQRAYTFYVSARTVSCCLWRAKACLVWRSGKSSRRRRGVHAWAMMMPWLRTKTGQRRFSTE